MWHPVVENPYSLGHNMTLCIVDLFFSQCIPCNDTLGNRFFQISLNLQADEVNTYISTCMLEHVLPVHDIICINQIKFPVL